jgi:hypothetical protein
VQYDVMRMGKEAGEPVSVYFSLESWACRRGNRDVVQGWSHNSLKTGFLDSDGELDVGCARRQRL